MTTDQILLLIWNQTWQIALLGLLVAVMIRTFARDRPRLGHFLCALVLMKCLIPPVWSSHIGPFSWLASATKQLSIPWMHDFASPTPSSTGGRTSSHSDFARPTTNAHWDIGISNVRNTDGTAEAIESTNSIPSFLAIQIRFRHWTTVIFWSWLVSVILISLWSWGRYLGFLIWIKRATCFRSDRVDGIVCELAQLLNIRRPIRVKLLRETIGPAVVGLFFPCILLPQLIVDGLNPVQLRALIAHEMIHIRRGDLRWSLLQMIANCLWWFHPVIWLVNRRLSQESERICDEETVASLQCDVGTYALCLLSVLEHKHQLHIAPALPGVRPLQITANRLESIMKFKHGSYQRSPIWIWGAFFTLGVILMPGAQLGIGQQQLSPLAPLAVGPAVAIADNTAGDSKVEEQVVTFSYSIQDLLNRIVADGYVASGYANEVLQNLLQIYRTQRPEPVEPVQDRKGYLVDRGDMLGVLVEGILPNDISVVPAKDKPYIEHGFPIVVRKNGTISLPSIPPIQVRGMTEEQVSESIFNAYVDARIVSKSSRLRPMVNLLKKRAVLGSAISVPKLGPAPLAFDFAFPVTYCEKDSRQIFSFTMGLTR